MKRRDKGRKRGIKGGRNEGALGEELIRKRDEGVKD